MGFWNIQNVCVKLCEQSCTWDVIDKAFLLFKLCRLKTENIFTSWFIPSYLTIYFDCRWKYFKRQKCSVYFIKVFNVFNINSSKYDLFGLFPKHDGAESSSNFALKYVCPDGSTKET